MEINVTNQNVNVEVTEHALLQMNVVVILDGVVQLVIFHIVNLHVIMAIVFLTKSQVTMNVTVMPDG